MEAPSTHLKHAIFHPLCQVLADELIRSELAKFAWIVERAKIPPE